MIKLQPTDINNKYGHEHKYALSDMDLWHTQQLPLTWQLTITYFVGSWETWLYSWISDFQSESHYRYLEYSLWNCTELIAMGHYWWSVNMRSDIGLVPSGNTPFHEPIRPSATTHMALVHNEVTCIWKESYKITIISTYSYRSDYAELTVTHILCSEDAWVLTW